MIRNSVVVLMIFPLWSIAASPAKALTATECSVKYEAAQKAGTLKGQKWNDFRKTQCSGEAAAPAAASTAVPAPATVAPASTRPAAATRSMPSTPASGATFPKAVAPKYSTESAGKARMHTCLDQYNANKATNANGGLNWVAKGGGYYSQCNTRLKG